MIQQMNCIIIDDDKLSSVVVENFIRKTDFLKLLQNFDNPIDAINFINGEEQVDLIFLDIEMPDMNGIEFMKSLEDLPQVIITSAKKEYAIDAFEFDVTDYLLKPISYARLYKAVDKAYSKFREFQIDSQNSDGFFIKSSSSLVRVKYEEILWVEALENYVVINTADNKHTIHFTMKAIEKKLPTNVFTRVHRSYIVNLNKVDMIKDNMVIISVRNTQKQIPVAKSYKDRLLSNINLVSK